MAFSVDLGCGVMQRVLVMDSQVRCCQICLVCSGLNRPGLSGGSGVSPFLG
jgi:hypothetical protein